MAGFKRFIKGEGTAAVAGELLYTVQEFAEVMNVSRASLYRWHRSGIFKANVDGFGNLYYTQRHMESFSANDPRSIQRKMRYARRVGTRSKEEILQDEFIRPGDMMKLLGVSKATLYRWDASGVLPAKHKVEGGNKYYTRDQYVDFMKKCADQENQIVPVAAAVEIPETIVVSEGVRYSAVRYVNENDKYVCGHCGYVFSNDKKDKPLFCCKCGYDFRQGTKKKSEKN